MRRRRETGWLCIGLTTCCIALRAHGAVLYVRAGAAGANDGTSWANAYTNLQSALVSAAFGNEVWVAEGVYAPGNAREDVFVLAANVAVFGGFAGTETEREQRDWVNRTTILSGDIGVPGDTSDNSYRVIVGADDAVLDGFTITGGESGTNWPFVSGAGLFNDGVSITVANCRFEDNAAFYAAGNGGAIFNRGGSTVISNCTFVGNSAYWGGAICNLNAATALIVDCHFDGNRADFGGAVNSEGATVTIRRSRFIANTGDGGGINNRGCSPLIENCVFAGNNAGLWDGAGMRNVAASPCVINTLFVENRTREGQGGGAYSFNGFPRFVNCTFYGNEAELAVGGALFFDKVAGAEVRNGILWTNTAGTDGGEIFIESGTVNVSFSDIEGALNGTKCGGVAAMDGGGNIAEWPMFADESNLAGPDGIYGTADDGLQLNALLSGISPCIDTATTNGAPAFDLAGLSRPQYYGLDMGAFEYNPDYDGDGLDNLLEMRLGSDPHNADTDGDGISDGDEYYIYGTSPVLADTDGDGMPDAWEIANGLNPLVNDAGEDPDLDGVSNIEEYLHGLDPHNPSTHGSATDYHSVHGQEYVRHYYDEQDRLVGTEYGRGLSIGYRYDANGNLVRQVFLERDQDGDGLPDLWEFLNGLDWTDPTGDNGLYGDPDGDGWTNYQEWRANSSPTGAGNTPSTARTAASGTVSDPGEMSMWVAQFDPNGPPESVVLARLNAPMAGDNELIILTQTQGGWLTERLSVGNGTIDSISVSPVTMNSPSSVYVSMNRGMGTEIVMLRKKYGAWTSDVVRSGYSPAMTVLGALAADELLLVDEVAGIPNVVTLLTIDAEGNAAHFPQMAQNGDLYRLLTGVDGGTIPRPTFWTAGDSVYSCTRGGYDDFEDGMIDKSLWTMTRSSSTRSAYSESGGRLRLTSQCFINDVNHATALSRNVWENTHSCIRIRIPTLGQRTTSSTSNYADLSVKLGSSILYRLNGSISGNTQREILDLEIQVARLSGLAFRRYRSKGVNWTSWSNVGTSGALEFMAASGDGNSRAGDAWMHVESVEYCAPADLLVEGASANLSSGTRHYSQSVGQWLDIHSTARPWADALNLAWESSLGLAVVQGAVENEWIRSKAGSEVWLGLYRASVTCAWEWVDGSPVDYENWADGEPSGAPDALCAFMRNSDGKWGATNGGELKASARELTRRAAIYAMPNPCGNSPVGVRSHRLAVGSLRAAQPSDQTLLLAGVDDANSSNQADMGDDYMLHERRVNAVTASFEDLGTGIVNVASARPSERNAVACVPFVNTRSTDVAFTADPDGLVWLWHAPNAADPLENTLFTDVYRGYEWHGLAAYHGIDGPGALVGLCVHPSSPEEWQLIYWHSEHGIPDPDILRQTAPVTHILSEPDRGAGVSEVKIRVWDAEGNRVVPFLQYRDPTTLQWKDATIIALDDAAYSLNSTVEAMPSGSDHTFLWYSGHDIGTDRTNNVLLRACAVDITLWGDWSEPVTYHVDGTTDSNNDGMPDDWKLACGLHPLLSTGGHGPSCDPDEDGVSNIDEYRADTDPLDGQSYLAITGVRLDADGLRIEWQGGIQAWQRIQVRESLTDPDEEWETIHTVTPPTPVSGHAIDAGVTGRTLFYRIEAGR
jgi:YD repeat-containing protein